MLSFLKRHKILWTILLCLLCAVLVVTLIYHIHCYLSVYKYMIEDFGDYKGDFAVLADFCTAYAAQKQPNNGETFWFYCQRNSLSYNGQPIALTDEVLNCLERVDGAFPHKDAQLDGIRCTGDAVYFVTHSGQYAVAYSPNGKPTSVSGLSAEDVFTISASDGWYHVARNNH